MWYVILSVCFLYKIPGFFSTIIKRTFFSRFTAKPGIKKFVQCYIPYLWNSSSFDSCRLLLSVFFIFWRLASDRGAARRGCSAVRSSRQERWLLDPWLQGQMRASHNCPLNFGLCWLFLCFLLREGKHSTMKMCWSNETIINDKIPWSNALYS